MPPRSIDPVVITTTEPGLKVHPLLTRNYAVPASFEEHILRTSPMALDLGGGGQQPLRREGSLGMDGPLKEIGRDAAELSPGTLRQSDRLFDAPVLSAIAAGKVEGADGRPSRQFDRAFEHAAAAPGVRHCDRSYEVSGLACSGVGSRQLQLARAGSLLVPPAAKQPGEVTLYVGRNRTPYTLCVDTLRSASYFRTLLEKRGQEPGGTAIVVDCDEALFQNVLCLLRYKSWEALPAMSDAELYKMKKELEFFGVSIPESSSKKPTPASTVSGSSSVAAEPTAKRTSRNTSPSSSPSNSLSSSSSSSPNASPNRHRHHRLLHHKLPSADLPDLPDLPPELGDVSKLVLVTRMDDDPTATCEHCSKFTTGDCPPARTCWALSFQYRHTFCTRCGQPAPASMAPKYLAEIFLTAATYYSECAPTKRWSVGSNSTCSLKFLNAKPCCSCTQSSKQSALTTWAVSTFHSHAFCTQCGLSADGATLTSLLLTLRYGGLQRKPGRKDQNLVDLNLDSSQPQMQAPQQGKNSHLRASNRSF